MRKFIISVSTLLTLTSCQKTVFVWTFGDVVAITIIGGVLLLFLFAWVGDTLGKLFKTKKKK